MKKFYGKMLKHRRIVILLYLCLTVLAVMAAQKVQVDTNLADYLPEDSLSTISIDVMGEEFDGEIPNAELMVKDISLKDAVNLEDALLEIEGVNEVTGIGDTVDLAIPIEMYPEDTVESYYKDGNALYYLALDESYDYSLVETIEELAGDNAVMSGSFVNSQYLSAVSSPEITKIVGIAVVFAIIILSLTMSSWLDPLLVLASIGIAILLNSGTNLLLGTISSVTKTAASVLQLGVSVDYSIFLLHRYREYQSQGMQKEEAMAEALATSMSSIASSALTTVIGFLALIFMRYRIGADMGIVLSKGVLLSLICVFTLFPCMVLSFSKWIDATQHKVIIRGVGGLPNLIRRLRIPTALIFVAAAGICVFVQQGNTYYYGTSHQFKDSSQIKQDQQEIESVFGMNNTMVLLVPSGDTASEYMLCEALEDMEAVKSVTSYVSTLSPVIPSALLPDSIVSQLESEDYSRIVLKLSADEESEETFALIDEINALAGNWYEDYYLAGTSVSTYDLKTVISADTLKINAITIGAIFLILLLTFHSLPAAVLLVLTIEGAIWIDMGISYFIQEPLFYIGYLIVSSILIGATVDYAILLTSRYVESRAQMDKKAAREDAIRHSAISIFTSAIILSAAGLLLQLMSTSQLTAQLGGLLAKGTSLALIIVLFVLPNALVWLDAVIVRQPQEKAAHAREKKRKPSYKVRHSY